MTGKKKIPVITLLLLAAFFPISQCTFIKMGSLFLSGDVQQKNFTREVDIEYTGRLIFIRARLNDHTDEYRFLFDTGAAVNVITPQLAKRLAIKGVVEDTIADSSRKRGRVTFCKIPRITIGDISFTNTAAAIMPLDTNLRISCYRADGVVGASLLRLVNGWQIDYQQRKLRFSDKKKWPHPENTQFIPMRRNMQRIPQVEVAIPGNLVIKVGVDLGSTAGILSDLKTWRLIKDKNPQFSFLTGEGEMAGGALGDNIGKTYTVIFRQISIGNRSFGPQVCRFMPNIYPSIGNTFFQDYTVTFNWSKETIAMTPTRPVKKNLTEPTYGFDYSLDQTSGQLYVSFIYRQSPAGEAGLLVGDRIVAVNGKALPAVSKSTFCDYFLAPEKLLGEGAEIDLVIQRKDLQKRVHLKKRDLLAKPSTDH